MAQPVLIVGAGIAGLACARALHEAGCPALVLERSAGVGGRCATRRVDGQPVDHGVAFLHGGTPPFLAALHSAEGAARLDGWPERVAGSGSPCHPGAFRPGQIRVAFAEGVAAFPKKLAQGIEVQRRAEVREVGYHAGRFRLMGGDGAAWEGREVVLALAAEQAAALLGAAGLDAVRPARALLDLIPSVPCLTLIAGYPPTGPGPGWDLLLPESSSVVQVVSHDSAKRAAPRWRVLVVQARPGWSRRRLSSPPESWSRELLQEAARLVGAWVAAPAWQQPHRWRYARSAPGPPVPIPPVLELPGGGRLALAGEGFSAQGGAEGAWWSGTRAAARLMGVPGGGA